MGRQRAPNLQTLCCWQMNQGDISYKDSLMSYVKDLGPIAQMVAKRKLLGQQESNGCGIGISAATQRKPVGLDAKEFRTFRDFAPAGCSPFLKARDIIDLTKDGEEANGRNKREDTDHNIGTPAGKEKIEIPSPKEKVTLKVRVTSRNTVAVGKDLNCSSTSCRSFRDGYNVRPVILALENSHSNVAEFKSRNKKSCIVPMPLTKPRPAYDDEARQQQQQQQPPLPLISQFTFDLPFLKARLNQMNNAVEIGRKLRCWTRGAIHCLRGP